MIVIGTDTHIQSHTAGALDATTSRVIADRTVRAKRRSFDDLLAWTLSAWAIEDCRHVSGALELTSRGRALSSSFDLISATLRCLPLLTR